MEENIKISLEIGLLPQVTGSAKYIPVLHCGENDKLSYSYYANNEEELIELITDYVKDVLKRNDFDLYLDDEGEVK